MLQSVLVGHHQRLHVGIIGELIIPPPSRRWTTGHSCSLSIGFGFKRPQENGAVSSARCDERSIVGKEATISYGTPVPSILTKVLDGGVNKRSRG